MSNIFTKENRLYIEKNVLLKMNNFTINEFSPRSVGDAVQSYLEKEFLQCIPAGLIKDFNASFARRAMADFAFTDINNNYYIVDNKTHNINTSFNMPNITSVERLSRFYQDKNNFFTILFLAYSIENTILSFNKCLFIPIEMIDWSCLTIGALGWGQIQLVNSNNIRINENNTKKQWMLTLCDILEIFYPKEISKITERRNHFIKIREYWEEQPDY